MPPDAPAPNILGATPPPPGEALPRRGSRAVALTVATAMFMEQLDGTVLATALPSMARSFGVDPAHMSVVLTSYLVSLAVFIPASGRLADRLGSRSVFCGSIVLFTLGSIMCAQAGTVDFLVFARVVQGIGGAMMVPVGRLVLLQTTRKSELISANNWLLVPAALGPMMGPPVGGFLVTNLSWHWIFYINVPMGVLGIALGLTIIPQLRGRRDARFDPIGLVTSGIGFACLVFGLELASHGRAGLRNGALVLCGSAASFALYAVHARRITQPILDLGLMRVSTFRLSMFGGAATRITIGATPFLLPMTLQLGLGMNAARSGLTTFVASVGALCMRGLARRLLRRFGYRRTMIWNGLGASFFAFSCATLPLRPPIAAIYAVLFIGGFLQSLQFTAYNTIAYADVPAARLSAATSFYSTIQQVTLTLGVCVAALAVEAASRGAVPGAWQFSAGFLTVGAVGLLAPLLCARLEPEAGQEMSGHAEPRG